MQEWKVLSKFKDKSLLGREILEENVPPCTGYDSLTLLP
jgi:hypothetical protein